MSEDIRPGEIAVTLPEKFDAGVYFIGRIRTPWKTRARMPEERARLGRRLHHRARSALCGALDGVAPARISSLLYFMHEARRDLVVQAPRHHGEPRGTFAIRSPVRPNPIAMSVVRLVRDRGHALASSASTASTARR